jgi:hypothetical protein
MAFVGVLGLALILRSGAISVQNGAQVQLNAAEQARESALESSWSKELEDDSKKYKSPIKRVVALLTQMKAQLEKEAADEAAMYDKMVCWCETNEKQKTKAVADAEAADKELSAEIESRAAKFGELSTEIASLKKQIAEDTAALKEATAIREKEAGAFSAEEKELMQNVVNVKNAIQVLSKHHSGASFVQMDEALMSSIRAILRDLAFKHELMVVGNSERKHSAFLSLNIETKRVSQSDGNTALGNSLLSALDVQGAAAADALPLDIAQKVLARSAGGSAGFLQGAVAPTGGSYAPQSSAIFGILKTLKEDFESNLSAAQKEEMKAAADFKSMSDAKTSQIAAGKAKLDEYEGQNADNQKALSDAKEELELTRDQRSQDIKFLQNLKLTCMDLDKQWAERSKTRSEETKAVSEAISIITSDDSMDLLRQTVSFIQVDSNADSEEGAEMKVRRSRAVAALRKAAGAPGFNTDDLLEAWHSRVVGAAGGPRTQLSTLAVTVSLDSFTKLKEVMDKMVADLKKEQEDEVQFKAHCEKEFDETEKETFAKTEAKKDLESTIDRLEKLLETLAEEIAAAKSQIADTEVAIKKASQVREGENADFQSTVADQRATQEILKKALDKLTTFYKKAMLVQEAKQEPPVKFNAYKKNSGSNSVIGMIEQIIEDSKALEAEAVAGETAAQASYETFVKDSNNVISELTESVAMKTKATATAKLDMEQAKSDLQSTENELESLALYEGDLHKDCDFVLKNFNIRQKARLDEMEAIQQAKAILSGSM